MFSSIKYIEEVEDLAEIWADALKEDGLAFVVSTATSEDLKDWF